MADLFPNSFPNAKLWGAIFSPAIQKARRVYRIRFLPDSFLQLFRRCWQWSYGHHLPSDCHSFSTIREKWYSTSTTPSGREPTVPELGMLILGGTGALSEENMFASQGDLE